MDQNQIADIIGFIAAGLGIFTFFPQAYAVWKTKHTKDISLATYAMINLGSLIWGTYGIMIGSRPLIFVNSVILLMAGYTLAMKIKYK